MRATETSLRAALRTFGLKMGSVTRKTWEGRARDLADDHEILEGIVEAMLPVRALSLKEPDAIDGRLAALAKSDPVTRLLMTMPGIGVIVALSSRSAVDDPDRFRRSRDVGAWLGLTPRRWRSGKTDIIGRIAKAGDALRGRRDPSRPGPHPVAAEGMGPADREEDLHEEGDRCRKP